MNHCAACLRLFLYSIVLLAASPSKAGVRVLYLGDSLSFGAFGTTLDKLLAE